MYQMNLQPDLTSYSTVIHAYSKALQPQHGERLFSEMMEKKIQPNVTVLITLIHGYTLIGEIPKCQELFEYMKQNKN